MSGTICAKHPKGQFLANGNGHLFPARSLVKVALVQVLIGKEANFPLTMNSSAR